jgi:hypothetical protein
MPNRDQTAFRFEANSTRRTSSISTPVRAFRAYRARLGRNGPVDAL